MTRQHFQALADALKSAKPTTNIDARVTWGDCCECVAEACRNLNPKFDRIRFLKACGYVLADR